MRKWKLVPVEATEEMVLAAVRRPRTRDGLSGTYNAMVAAAPRASEDDALIEQVARALARRDTTLPPRLGRREENWPHFRDKAHAWIDVLNKLEALP